jgi:hypothetical protein
MAAMTSSPCCSLGEQKLLPRGPRRLLATLSVALHGRAPRARESGGFACFHSAAHGHLAAGCRWPLCPRGRQCRPRTRRPRQASLFVFQLRNCNCRALIISFPFARNNSRHADAMRARAWLCQSPCATPRPRLIQTQNLDLWNGYCHASSLVTKRIMTVAILHVFSLPRTVQ